MTPPGTSPRIFVSAGEPSGDLHGAAVVRELRRRYPEATIEGFGGRHMAEAGARITVSTERLSGFGFVEVLGKIPGHYRLLRGVRRRFAAAPYDLAIVIDYPGFHIRVAAAAKAAGSRVLYYVAPQLWAWRPGRARRLRAAVDKLAVILPFEEAFFRGLGMDAEFVGNPVLDHGRGPTREEARRRLGLPAEARVLGVLPGSRDQEIRRHWDIFRAAVARVRAAGACDRVVVAGIPGASYEGLDDMLLVRDRSALVFAAADALLAKSGTTTLEAAVAGTPMVVAYRTHPLTYLMARRLSRVRWVSLVNLVADREVVPELLQHEATPERLADALLPLLDPERPERRAQCEGMAEVRARLGGPGAGRRVAELAVGLLAG